MKKALLFGFLTVWVVACAPTQNWISTPLKQTYDDEHVSIEFEPRKRSKTYYDGFFIVVTNKTDQTLVVDWNRTRYLLNGKAHGRFGFEGVTKENINDLPSDDIPPGQTFSKLIFPLNLIAWKPYRSEYTESASFTAGPIPAGASSIALVIRRGSQLIQPTVGVRIRMETQ